jgi:mannitol/fructose-specific phosphotransferase system IIA component (Ntr-type)
MKLKPFITKDRIIIGLEPGDRREIMRQLAQPIVDAECIEDLELFLDHLETREDQITTVMENGVAFPHARSQTVRRLCVVVGVTEAGIQFGPDKNQKSNLFILIGVPSFAPTAHIPILQVLANYARDPKRVERLVASKTPSQIVRSLANLKG